MSVVKQTFSVGDIRYYTEGHYELDGDNCLTYRSGPAVGGFELFLGDGYLMFLGVDRGTGECGPAYSRLPYTTAFKKASLQISDAVKAGLYYQSDWLKTQDGGHYFPFLQEVYCDPDTLIFAFGNVEAKGTLIEFAENTYAMLDHEVLKAIYLKVSQDVFDGVFKFNKKLKRKIVRHWLLGW